MPIRQVFELTAEHVESFRSHGFVKLEGLFESSFIEYLQARIRDQMVLQDEAQQGFGRLGYDIFERDRQIAAVLAHTGFRALMTRLADRDLFYTQGLGFEIQRNKHYGFPWHIGTQSFGYQRLSDYGCSIWIPLTPIDPNAQGGGMSYVSKQVLSGRFMYEEADPAIDALLAGVEAWDTEHDARSISLEEFGALRHGVLNSPAMQYLLGYHKQTDAFALGDALVFDKHVLHTSEPLGDGPFEHRAAFVMRFVDIDARYDQKRAQALEFPRRYFGHPPKSDFHLRVCQRDGELIRESRLFDAPEVRALRR